MQVSASMYHRLYNKIRVVGTRNEAGECLVNEVYKVGSSLNLLVFEFRDRRFPCGGFSRNDVAEMNTLLEKEGVEFVSKKEKKVSDSAPSFSVEVHDVVDETKVKVVQEMPYVRGQPSQKTLTWIRTALDLPAHKAAETADVETTIFQEFEILAQGNDFALANLKAIQAGGPKLEILCRDFLKAIYPAKPEGKSFQKDCFWARITPWARIALLSKSPEYQATKAAFLRLKRLHRKGVHPIAIFVPTPNAMPQLRTWADADSGYVPRDGK